MHQRQQRLGGVVGMAVDGGLRLGVVELGEGAHQHAMEAVLALAAVGADHHAHRDRGAVLARLERAQIVGDALRQHRHDAVGEVDGVAAQQRLAVERRARRDVMGDVGDGDVDDEAAGILGVGVGPRKDRVVVVLGVDRIDGDERHLAPVLAAVEVGGAAPPPPRRGRRGGTGAGMPWAWMAIRLTAFSLASEPSRSFTCALRQAETAAAGDLDGDEIAVLARR